MHSSRSGLQRSARASRSGRAQFAIVVVRRASTPTQAPSPELHTPFRHGTSAGDVVYTNQSKWVVVHGRKVSPFGIATQQLHHAGLEVNSKPFPLQQEQAGP